MMMNSIFSGHQPNFLPYMGFFYKVFKSDVFVLDDDVQYSRTEWHNSNYIKVNGSKHKITVPVTYDFGQKINEVRINRDRDWQSKLLKTVQMNYGKAPYFHEGYELLQKGIESEYEYLSDMNIHFITEICNKFGFDTVLMIASKDVPTTLKNNYRNAYQCLMVGADTYYSGIGGKEYNDEELYNRNGIQIVYSDYEPVVYRQGRSQFIENLSVIDYIFHQGFRIPDTWRR